jgi:hypothetical protein
MHTVGGRGRRHDTRRRVRLNSLLFRLDNLAEVDRFSFATSNAYTAASNGERFLVAVNAPDPAAPPINIVVNWRALLRR